MTDLRARQRALARDAILEACAQLVSERRHMSFTMREVADRAGVSLRTVYNHFAAREDLLDALSRRVDDEMAVRGSPSTEDLGDGLDLEQAVRRNFALFEELGGVSEALAQLPLADVGRDEERSRRTAAIVEHVTALIPDAAPDDARELALLIRHLISHRSWFWLTREYGLTTDQVTELVPWAVDALLRAAQAAGAPVLASEPEGEPEP